MPDRPRIRTTALLEWLQDHGQAFYLLDDERRIVFISPAAAAWAGVEPSDLLRRRCDYTSAAAEPLDSAANALAPPPEVFRGERLVIERHSLTENAIVRYFEFLPLRDQGVVTGVLAILHTERPSVPLPGDEATDLHEQLQLARRAWRTQYPVARLRGESPDMRQIRAQVALAAQSGVSVLIVGRAGSGRSTIARTIHAASDPQAEHPLISLEAVKLTSETLDNQLSSWSSRLELNGVRPAATLLVEAIDRLPADGQATLFEAIKGPAPRWRILATTVESLAEQVATGAFREDLAAAVATLTIRVPSLAKRRGELPLIAQGLLEEFNAHSDKQLAGYTNDALDALAAYGWPGEMAELAQYIAECCARAEGPHVTRNDLPNRIHQSLRANHRAPRTLEPIQLETHLAAIERDLIEQALKQAKGNKTKAAKLLGLTRPRLYRRMVQLGFIAEDLVDEFVEEP